MEEYRVDIIVEFEASDKSYLAISNAVHGAVKGLCSSHAYIKGEGKNRLCFFSLPDKNIRLKQSEQEFSESIAKRVWKANKGYCDVEVVLQHHPKLPKEKVSKFSKSQYNALTKSARQR
jgi:hypothetical protein